MQIVRENLNINWLEFMAALATIPDIENKNLDYFGKKVILQVPDDWSHESALDTAISDNSVVDSSQPVTVSEVSIKTKKNIDEFKRKISKKSFFSKILEYNIKVEEDQPLKLKDKGTLYFKCSADWSSTDTQELDDFMDSLLGYDVVAVDMDIYTKRMKAGLNFYNEERTKLVHRMEAGEYTPDELYHEIDTPLTPAKTHLILGDLKSAYKDINDTDTVGKLTPEIKSGFLSGLGSLIGKYYD